MKNITLYSTGVWPLKKRRGINLEGKENGLLEKNDGEVTDGKVTNEYIREIMKIQHIIIDDLRTKQSIRFGCVQGVKDQRVLKQTFKWQPERKKRGEK